jgi:uncharacterized delta-60 repeat protein
VLIGGEFGYYVNGTLAVNVARLNADGTLDSSFLNLLDTSSRGTFVAAVALQRDGKVLIGGALSTINGISRNGIARLNADGTLDSGFQNGSSGLDSGSGSGWAKSIAVQSDGKVLIGGDFTMVEGVSRNYVARLNADGTLDTGFQNGLSGTDNYVDSVVPQSDGKVLIGGAFTVVNGVSRNYIARLNADGTLDTGFQNGLSGVDAGVGSVALQSDGKVLIAGNFTTVNGAASIARLWGSADIPPQLKSIVRSGAYLNLTWDALPNRSYRVQHKETLAGNTWTDLVGDISTTTGTASKTDATLGNASRRFYRVLLLP